MGASHATLSSTSDEDSTVELEGYAVEQRLYPGSGRMMRTFRLKSNENEGTVVAKTMLLPKEENVDPHEKELLRIKQALQNQPHVAPFLVWNIVETTPMMRQVYLLRPHVYTTLSDRLASRPFLSHTEKLFIVFQLLDALEAMHASGVVHGFVTTENIGLTSWNWVVLLDVSSYKSITALPDDDPSSYLYYFQELNKHVTVKREKRCYLAPERFYTPSSRQEISTSKPLTPAMDIFSAGCVVMELCLNGERAMDLGDLMEYRKSGGELPTQRLHKIESSSLRAACRHMLSLHPEKRLSAHEYRERLNVPATFGTLLYPLMEDITSQQVTPDARMAVAASYYGRVLRECMSVHDKQGEVYFSGMLGPCMLEEPTGDRSEEPLSEIGNTTPEDRLLAETQALLKKLESPTNFDDEDDDPLSIVSFTSPQTVEKVSPPSPEAASSLLIYLQVILSTIRSVQKPSSRLVGLQLLQRLASYSSDDTKLQRIVPATISLLHDQDSLVRASAVQVLTSTLVEIRKFAPSDSNVFPQYVLKRVAHLIGDPSLVVRVAFARCVASLADTALRFLDITHAVRLYEAVGGDSTESTTTTNKTDPGVFTDDVANLLVGAGDKGSAEEKSPGHSRKSSMGTGNTLISSTYTLELSSLHEIVSRWVVHIATDQSDQSSPPKRSLLHDLARLCNFFGRDGVMAFILPQILAFLNDRRDWQLRASLFERLASVCFIIGRAATEHFVLPCLETALVDAEDQVMSRALSCLSSLVEMGLLSRSVLMTPQAVLPSTGIPGKPKRGLFEKYIPLLLYPSPSVRRSAVALVNASCRALGFPDSVVFLLPLLRPYLRFEPSTNHLTTPEGLEKCLIPPWSRTKLNEELKQLSKQSQEENQLGNQWTSIGGDLREAQDTKKAAVLDAKQHSTGSMQSTSLVGKEEHELNSCMIEYLTMLLRSRGPNAFGMAKSGGEKLDTAIEGSMKLAQHVKFPNQKVAGTTDVCIPEWYCSLGDGSNVDQSASCAIRSVSSLSQVYGLSVIQDPSLVDSRVTKDTVIVGQKADESPKEEISQSDVDVDGLLHSPEAKILQGASAGEWGSDTLVDATVTDTALLVSKLNGLHVPPLPPNLGVVNDRTHLAFSTATESGGDASVAHEWKPRADMLIASSSFANGHTGPVSRLAVAPDDRYFVSGSYDGTLRVWESRQAKGSDGVLVSSATYSGHCHGTECPRINDVATVENTNSMVSGASDGSLHVWRIDMVSTASVTAGEARDSSGKLSENRRFDRSRVSGSSVVRKIDPDEGEIHAVSHFNSTAASIVMFATQSIVHSMDLRQPREPFKLRHQPDVGYLTSMALGADRHWMITGTSRGFVCLWDIRFQQMVKLWQHSSACPVTRLATAFTSLPKKWGVLSPSDNERRPSMFVACGVNECGMFDVLSGSCRQCFRVVGPRSSTLGPPDNSDSASMPLLREVDPFSPRKTFRLDDFSTTMRHVGTPCSSINALVGSVGSHDPSCLVTGGDDGYIRYWDFSTPSKCFTVSGHPGFYHRPTYERVDVDGQRLMLCRQAPAPRRNDIESSRVPRMVERGPVRSESRHQDSVQDVKVLSFPETLLVSCSRDSTVKLWR